MVIGDVSHSLACYSKFERLKNTKGMCSNILGCMQILCMIIKHPHTEMFSGSPTHCQEMHDLDCHENKKEKKKRRERKILQI